MGELEPGQPVMLVRSSNDMRYRKPEEKYVPAYVIKVARVWVTVDMDPESTGTGWNSHRMRMDDQTEGTQYSGSEWRFVTLPQYEWEKTQTWARGVLAEHGVRLDSDSRWRGRETELAQILVELEEA